MGSPPDLHQHAAPCCMDSKCPLQRAAPLELLHMAQRAGCTRLQKGLQQTATFKIFDSDSCTRRRCTSQDPPNVVHPLSCILRDLRAPRIFLHTPELVSCILFNPKDCLDRFLAPHFFTKKNQFYLIVGGARCPSRGVPGGPRG